jgi:hypothetical protein
MVGVESSPPHFKRDTPITISAFMLTTDTPDRFTFFEVSGKQIEMAQVIIIGASGDTRDTQKQHQGIFMP